MNRSEFDWVRTIWGEHAIHAPGQLILQAGAETAEGRHLTVVAGLLVTPTPLLSAFARAHDCPHELIVGDLVIRPHGKFTSRQYVGYGVSALLTSEAMFPAGYEYKTLDNGFSRLHPESPHAEPGGRRR